VNAPLSAVGKALLFTVVWQVVTGLVCASMRTIASTSFDAVLMVALFLLMSYFPILVATDIGYRSGKTSGERKPGGQTPSADIKASSFTNHATR